MLSYPVLLYDILLFSGPFHPSIAFPDFKPRCVSKSNTPITLILNNRVYKSSPSPSLNIGSQNFT